MSWNVGHKATVIRVVVLATASSGLVAGTWGTASASVVPLGCVSSNTTVTCTFSSIGAEQQFVVPEGVRMLAVTAIGGAGGTEYPVVPGTPSGYEAPGGLGGEVRSHLPVLPHMVLYVEVGGNGQGVGAGGFNGGGSGGTGGGGGASDIRLLSRSNPFSLFSRVLVAGGGGGGGVPSCDAHGLILPSGIGGDAGQAGSPAAFCVGARGTSSGGGAGTLFSGGAAGTTTDVLGSSSQGSPGLYGMGGSTTLGAGAGGGGVFGGATGAGPTSGPAIDEGDYNSTGPSGGGGGSSLTPYGGTAGVTTAPPRITIAYTA